jgi:hypothetical protein
VVQHHAILRTVFVARQGQLYQLVLRAYNPEFLHYDCDDCPRQELVASAIQEDMLRPVRLGAGSIRFILTKQGRHQHTLIIRIQHAQYDGVSVPTILNDIKLAYAGTPLAPAPDFSLFIHYQQQANLTQERAFWRQLLQNAPSTQLVVHDRPAFQSPVNRSIIRTVEPHSLSTQGITFATLTKAAWSLVLGQLLSTTDVVFGQVTTGRNSRHDCIEEISGPCVNMIPVRVRMAAGWTVGDLLHAVQDQHRSTIPHETLGFQDIIENCTNWPRWTRFSSILQHTNLGHGVGEASAATITSVQLAAFSPPTDCADVWIWSAPAADEGQYTFDFTYSDRTFPPALADQLADMLADSIQTLSSNVEAPLSTYLLSSPCHTPFPLNRPPIARTRTYQAHRDEHSESPLSSLASWSQVENAWRQALPNITPDTYTADTPFFDIWGDLIFAVQLCALYSTGSPQALDIEVEEIIQNPTMRDQALLLAYKAQHHRRRSSLVRYPTPSVRQSIADSQDKRTIVHPYGTTRTVSAGSDARSETRVSRGNSRPSADDTTSAGIRALANSLTAVYGLMRLR